MVSTWLPPPLPGRFTDTADPPFVGRADDLSRLEEAWELVENGERQVVFLGGEPGSGKSRIAAEMARALHHRGVVVLLGTASLDLSYPYEPFVEALNHLLLATEPGALAPLISDRASELLRVTPHLRRHRPDLADPPATPQERRHELFGAFVDVIAAVAAERPLAIFLEDMHWATAPTRLLMSHLIESSHGIPLLVLATMRSTAPDRSSDLSYLMADLYRLPGVRRIDLSGLKLEDIESYVAAESGKTERHLRETAALLRDQTGGNPFFLREMWREVAKAGGVEALRTKRVTAPYSVRDSLERRIRSFDPLGRTVLEHAAVLGVRFSGMDVVEAAGVSADDALGALDLAVGAGLILPIEGGAYAFQHHLIRQAIIDGLTPSQSARIHARLAETISERHTPDRRLEPLLARLYEGARALGYQKEAVHHLSQAAESARQGLAHEEAAELWEQAARAAGDVAESEAMLLSAAQCHLLAGDFPEARRVYREVNGSGDPSTALRAAIGFEDASWRPGVLGHEARAILRASIDRIPADPTNPLYVRAQVALARSHTFSGEMDESAVIGADAMSMARSLGDEALVADALVAALLRAMNIPHPEAETSQFSLELRDIAMRTGDYDRLGPVGAITASTGYMNGDPDTFRSGWDDVHLAADKTGQPFWRWVDGCYRHCQEFMAGDFDSARTTAVHTNELGYAFGIDEAEGPFGLQMYMVTRETGRLEDIRPLITGDPAADGTWSPGLLSLYTELDMREPARKLFASSLALPDHISEMTAIYPAVIAFLVEAALYLGDVDALARLLPRMQAYEGSNLLVGQCVAVFGSSHTYLGRMHAAMGDTEEADRHFRRGLSMDLAIGSTVHQTTTLVHYASLLEKVGHEDRAEEYRRLARQLAEPINQVRVLRQLGIDGVTGLPDHLTAREMEVLRLLADGASNKEIGTRLFISQHTVANHVRSILTKTDSPNRTAAAAYAIERGLV